MHYMDYTELHENAIVVDTHNDVLMHLVDSSTWLPKFDLNESLKGLTEYGHVDINKLKEGGVNAAFFAVYAPERYYPGRELDRALSLINTIFVNIKTNAANLKHITGGVSELEAVTREKEKLAVVLSMEGLDMLDESHGIELLRQFNDLGIKVMSLTWNDSNWLGEGLNSVYANGRPSRQGLSFLGEKVIKEMNRLGILLDVSHLHERTYWDVIDLSSAPVIASHSGVKGIYKHRRNFSDKELYVLAENGGVIQINFARDFLCDSKSPASVKTIVDHIEYAKVLIGANHVGLGSDFDGANIPGDLYDASGYHKITREMTNRGFLEEEIVKILGENTIRVMKEAENRAERINNKKIKENSLKVIVDGQVYEPGKTSASLSAGGFHVITFVGKDKEGKEVRSSEIYYIKRK